MLVPLIEFLYMFFLNVILRTINYDYNLPIFSKQGFYKLQPCLVIAYFFSYLCRKLSLGQRTKDKKSFFCVYYFYSRFAPFLKPTPCYVLLEFEMCFVRTEDLESKFNMRLNFFFNSFLKSSFAFLFALIFSGPGTLREKLSFLTSFQIPL
jgi:hypothetical protein